MPDVAALIAELKRDFGSLPSVQRLTAKDVDAMYSLAYHEYGQAHYEQALRYFGVLLLYRPAEVVYIRGAALCLKRLRRYPMAIAAYSALCLLEGGIPSHTLALAECQLLAQRHADARRTLAVAIGQCGADAANEPVRARAQAMLELMRSADEPLPA